MLVWSDHMWIRSQKCFSGRALRLSRNNSKDSLEMRKNLGKMEMSRTQILTSWNYITRRMNMNQNPNTMLKNRKRKEKVWLFQSVCKMMIKHEEYIYLLNIYMRDQNNFTSFMIKGSNDFFTLTFPWIYPVSEDKGMSRHSLPRTRYWLYRCTGPCGPTPPGGSPGSRYTRRAGPGRSRTAPGHLPASIQCQTSDQISKPDIIRCICGC